MALIKCPECGQSISDTDNRRPHCGFKLSKKFLSEISQQGSAGGLNSDASGNRPSYGASAKPKSAKRTVILATAAAASITAVAAALFFILSPKTCDYKFTAALTESLKKRWAATADSSEMSNEEKAEYLSSLSKIELDILSGYENREFKDPSLKECTRGYI